MSLTVDLFSYLPGLQVSPNEILESELFCQQILQAQFPDVDWRQGTGVTDMVIRPSATLLALVNKALIFYFSQNTTASVTDTTTPSIVDNLMSNWFMTRNQGSNSIINARLYFARPKNVTIPSSAFFSPDNVLKFYPGMTLTFSASQLTLDVPSNSYYLDVSLTAEIAGAGYNISSGSLLYFTTFDPYFLHAEINYLEQVASSSESNTQFVTRVGDTLSTRNLINVPSINSNLLQTFPLLSGVTPKGAGDPELIRDLVQIVAPTVASPIWIHSMGMVDVYCRVPLITTSPQFVTDTTGKVQVSGANYKITRSLLSGGAAADTVPVTSGSITTGSTALTVISAIGFAVGNSITVYGAGVGGADLNTTISAIAGSVLTLGTAASTTVTGVVVTISFILTNPNNLTYIGVTLTSSVGVATATYINHGYTVGRYITIAGSTQPEYNGSHPITYTTKDTFTFNITGTPVSPATGSITSTGVISNFDNGFSSRQLMQADFGVANANKTVSLNLYSFQGLNGIQTYLEGNYTKVLCADLLARGYNICLLDFSIVGYNGPPPNSTVALGVVETYLAGLVPGQIFVMSDLQSMLSAANISTIQTPIGVKYSLYVRDLVPAIQGTITDTYNPNDSTTIFIVDTLTTTSTSA